MAEEKEFTPDEYQLAAINAHGGHYLVLAPPGCGKTEILTERVVQARERGAEFDDMLCLTFTNRASRGMRDRIKGRIGQDAANIFIGNIHRFCSKYLFSEGVIPENTSIIDEDDQADMFYNYNAAIFSNKNGTVNKKTVKLVGDLAAYITQSRLGHPEDVKFDGPGFAAFYRLAETCNFDERAVPTDRSYLIYALRYLEYKRRRNIIDFADILILAYDHMLRNEHRRYRWIQIDEVQDLNPLQLAIVDILEAPDPTVMYLGDEQQAIFSFMGAKLSQLGLLKERCDGRVLTLHNNYRAPKYLLDVLNDYAEAELGVDPDLLPHPKDEAKIPDNERFTLFLTESATVDAEHARILGMVKYYSGLSDDGRLAILVTKNHEADRISETLTQAGISNFKISGIDMFKSKSYKTLSSFFSVLVNDFNFVAWSRLLYGINATPSLVKARALMSEMKRLMMTPSDLLEGESYLSRFSRRYATEEFVFFDTETTGLNVLEDDIVQIAAFKVRGGQRVPGSDFNIIMHTDREIPAMLGDKVNPLVDAYARTPHVARAEGLRRFLNYIGTSPLLGHNVNYDYRILQANVERYLGEAVEYDIFDSLHIIKCVEPDLRRYRLEDLLRELKLEGQNSHMADEDIAATKSLIDYCHARMLPVLPHQEAFLRNARTVNIISRIYPLRPLFENTLAHLFLPVSVTGQTIADELRLMHQTLVEQNLITDIGPKYDIFLRYIQSEWVDPSRTESLYDQISQHVYDITSTINEGDLVNSKDLLSERVFIMTVYKGKGLEFENVVVLGAYDGNYPYYEVNRILRNPNSLPEKRRQAEAERLEDARKFYVAISRAKKRLCISYTAHDTYAHDAGVTPFIRSIRHHFTFGRK